MRLTGTSAYGIRLPIISQGDNLPEIVADSLINAVKEENITLIEGDVIGVTEAIVAKAQGNFASIDDIAVDVKEKFPSGVVGVVFPILSRNRFYNILKGIAKGAKKVYVLLNYPNDEVGNPIIDVNDIDEIESKMTKPIVSGKEFQEITNNFRHPFTDVDYISLYEEIGDNVEVYVSKDPRTILTLTKDVLVADIHTREVTKKRLLKTESCNIYTLSDILSKPIKGSGYNSQYGVLGSNLSTDSKLKLFPRDCEEFVEKTQTIIKEKTGIHLEVLIYGDGAFKDPACGIWELADPAVSPAYTDGLKGQPNEIKLKFVADNVFSHLSGEEKTQAVTEMIRTKDATKASFSEGTTPRNYSDLLGSLCDLMSGSGDKGTPVILIKGYFDNLSSN